MSKNLIEYLKEWRDDYINEDKTFQCYSGEIRYDLLDSVITVVEKYNSKWISIKDKLPNQQKRVLVLTEDSEGRKRITVAEYIAPKTVLSDDYIDEDAAFGFDEYDEENDCYWTPAGFYENQYYTDNNFYINDEVTHWQELPSF